MSSNENRNGIDGANGHERHTRQNSAIATGALISWLGLAFYISSLGLLHGSAWLGLVLAGLGGATILAGLLRNANSVRRGVQASFIAGAAILLSGIWFITPTGEFWEGFWPLLLVFAGISVMISVLTRTSRDRTRHGYRPHAI